jgi:hypothetical protein
MKINNLVRKQKEQEARDILIAEFQDLIESDPDFNYSEDEFDEWVKDCVLPTEESEKNVCHNCGGQNVQIQVWLNANTNKVICDCSVDNRDGGWCEDCQKHVYVIQEKYFNPDDKDSEKDE